ncbi:MAG: DUF4395 domain-containing protein [Agriterribacter sp.]
MSKQETSGMYKDEYVIRITAAAVVILTVIILITYWEIAAVFLALDFGIRTFTVQHSLLSLIAKSVARIFRLKPKPVFAAPKKFAALLGFIFSTTIFALVHFHLFTEAYIVGGILICCAFLESAFNICIGCYVYDLAVAPVVNQRHLKNDSATESYNNTFNKL